jgi:SAM-dependent methyltransferase
VSNPRRSAAAGPGPSHDWGFYYDRTASRPARSTLRSALRRFDADWKRGARPSSPLAIDLGCGAGRDTLELLRRGWRVLAVDAEPKAIRALEGASDLPNPGMLTTRIGRFETFVPPPATLINASFALPLCPPEAFHQLWSRIVEALEPGGRFCGQLFGDRDSWAAPDSAKSGITFLTGAEASALVADLEVERFIEEEVDAARPVGETMHWHIYHIVAKRP